MPRAKGKRNKGGQKADVASAGARRLPCTRAPLERVQVYADGTKSVSWHLGGNEQERAACALHVVVDIARHPAKREAMTTVLDKLSRPSELAPGELQVAFGLLMLHSSSKNITRLARLAKTLRGEQEQTDDQGNRQVLEAIQAWSNQWAERGATAALLTTANRAHTASAVRRRMVHLELRQARGLRTKSPEFGVIKSALSWPLIYGWSGHKLEDPDLDTLLASIESSSATISEPGRAEELEPPGGHPSLAAAASTAAPATEAHETSALLVPSGGPEQLLQGTNLPDDLVAPSDSSSRVSDVKDSQEQEDHDEGEACVPPPVGDVIGLDGCATPLVVCGDGVDGGSSVSKPGQVTESCGEESERKVKEEVEETIEDQHEVCAGGSVALAPGSSCGGDTPIETRKGTGTTGSGAPSSGCSGGISAEAASSVSGHGSRLGYITDGGPSLDLLTVESGEGEGGNATVAFVTPKSGDLERMALKMAKDTASARRQLVREISVLEALAEMKGNVANIVRVVTCVKGPKPVLLMHAEKCCLGDVLDGGDFTVAMVARVMDDVLSAVDGLHESGFLHRDIKPDNIFVAEDDGGVLGDFGLSITTADASANIGLGDGTPEYVAPETLVRGWTVQAEMYAVLLCFAEALIGRTVFCGKDLGRPPDRELFVVGEVRLVYLDSFVKEQVDNELFAVGQERLVYLESVVDEQGENVTDFTEELDDLRAKALEDSNIDDEDEDVDVQDEVDALEADVERASSELKRARIQQYRLGVDMEGWVPNDQDQMGSPLSFFTVEQQEKYRGTEDGSDEQRALEMLASEEAKTVPSKLFEGSWVQWMPRFTKGTDCKEGVRRAMSCIVEAGALDADPSNRPKTLEAARELLRTARDIFQTEQQKDG